MHHSRMAPPAEAGNHQRNRSFSAAPTPWHHNTSSSLPTDSARAQSSLVSSPKSPSRHALDPTTNKRPMLSPSTSMPPIHQQQSSAPQPQPSKTELRYFPSYGRSDHSLHLRGQTSSSPGALMTTSKDDSYKKPNQKSNISGFGKLLKKLGSKSPDDEAVVQKRNKHKPNPITADSDNSAFLRNPHNIPLAPPAPPAPEIPSVEVGPRTYLQPELRIGLQESDNLLSSIPVSLRTRPSFSRPTRNDSNSASTSPSPTPSPSGSTMKNHTSGHHQLPCADAHSQPSSSRPSAVNKTTASPPPRGILRHTSDKLLEPAEPAVSMPSYPIGHKTYNYYETNNNSTEVKVSCLAAQTQKEPDNRIESDNDDDDDDESSNQTQRFSSWSYASTGKSSGTYSLYSTFGPESQPPSESLLELKDGEDGKYGNDQLEKDRRIVQDDQQQNTSMVDLAQIVANNLRCKSPARVITPDVDVEDDENDDSSSDSDDDIFVDATGLSQEDIEREKAVGKRISKRLSKRLSGNHFGSAGGLLMSISSPPPLPALPPKSSSSLPQSSPRIPVVKSASVDIADDNALRRAKSRSLSDALAPELESAGTASLYAENNGPKIAEPATLRSSDDAASSSSLIAAAVETVNKEVSAEKVEINTGLSPPPRRPLSQRRKRSFYGQSGSDQTRVELPEIRFDDPLPRDGEARFAAQKLWEGDESFVSKARAAEWLGQGKPLNSKALGYYMENFEFSGMRIDTAFRKLCSKLYFKAEAQQIDRILEVFGERFWTLNPRCIFGSKDIVYAVVYSLLLLNTDLHVAQGNHARMTRQAFVRNTMLTIQDQVRSMPPEKKRTGHLFTKAWEADMETCLKDLYTSVKHNQILQPLDQQHQQLTVNPAAGGFGLEKRNSMLSSKRVAEFRRGVNTMIRKTGRESAIYPEETAPRISVNPDRTSPIGSPRRDSFSSSISGQSSGALLSAGAGGTLSPSHHQPIVNFMGSHGSDLFTNRVPYIKEGVVVRKHLLENANQKAKHREWKDCFLVVGYGELKMYSMQACIGEERRSLLRMSSANTFASLADTLNKSASSTVNSALGTRWASTMPLIGTIILNHSLSNILPPPGYNRQRPHVCAIQQPNGGVFLFQSASQEEVSEWVETCNYWAARQSKEPLPGGVSNMEYGWSSCLDDVILDLDAIDNSGRYFGDPDAVAVYDWRPPVPPSVSSILNEQDQLEALQKHLNALSIEINEHRDLKRKILVKFPSKSQNHAKVLSNWEAKSNYLLHEIIKYQNYCDVLERSMKQRQHAEAETPPESQLSTLDYEETKLDLFSEIGKELGHLTVK